MEAKIAEFRQIADDRCGQIDAAAAVSRAQLAAAAAGKEDQGARGAPVALRLENYEVLAFLGKGAFGTTSLVKRKGTDLQFAMKTIETTRFSDGGEQGVQRLEGFANAEVAILSRVRHRHIIGYHGSLLKEERWDRRVHILMEYADSGDLALKIRTARESSEKFSEEKVLGWLSQIGLAVEYLHKQNILHRDLKPANILLKTGDIVKLGDFGISKVLGSSQDMANTVVGTPCYLSPEICKGTDYSKWADLWAFGCVAFELCELKRCFDAPNIPAAIYAICEKEAPPITGYSTEAAALVAALLSKDPTNRPDITRVLQMPLLRRALPSASLEQLGSELLTAAQNSDWDAMSRMIEQEPYLDLSLAVGPQGHVLHWACHNRNAAMVKLLLEAGGDIHVKHRPLDWTPLHRAVYEAAFDCALVCLIHGADASLLDLDGRSCTATNPDNIRAIRGLERVFEIRQQVEGLLKQQALPTFMVQQNLRQLLCKCSLPAKWFRETDLLGAQVDVGFSAAGSVQCNKDSSSALEAAWQRGDRRCCPDGEMVVDLVQMEVCDVQYILQMEVCDGTVRDAAQSKQVVRRIEQCVTSDVDEALLPHADLPFELLWQQPCDVVPLTVIAALNSCSNDRGSGDPSVVAWAKSESPSTSVLALLVEYHADVNAKDSDCGSSALSWAIYQNKYECARILLSEYGADISLSISHNAGRESPLHWALSHHEADAKSLLELLEEFGGYRASLKCNANGHTPLQTALELSMTQEVCDVLQRMEQKAVQAGFFGDGQPSLQVVSMPNPIAVSSSESDPDAKPVFVSFARDAGFDEKSFIKAVVSSLQEQGIKGKIFMDNSRGLASRQKRVEAVESCVRCAAAMRCTSAILMLSRSYFESSAPLELALVEHRAQASSGAFEVFPIAYESCELFQDLIPDQFQEICATPVAALVNSDARANGADVAAQIISPLKQAIRNAPEPATPDSEPVVPPSPGAGWKKLPIDEWTVEHTCKWLTDSNLGQYIPNFCAEDIDGFLLPELTNEVLLEDLKVSSKLHRIKILKLLKVQMQHAQAQDGWICDASTKCTSTVAILHHPQDTELAREMHKDVKAASHTVCTADSSGRCSLVARSQLLCILLSRAAASDPSLMAAVLFADELGRPILCAVVDEQFEQVWGSLPMHGQLLLGHMPCFVIGKWNKQERVSYTQGIRQLLHYLRPWSSRHRNAKLDASAEKLVLSSLKNTLAVAGASAEGVVSLGSSRNYASHNEKFVFVISYRSEAQEEMLKMTDSLRARFGDRCVVHGMMCKPGMPWDVGYFTWLTHATVILVLLSPTYFESPACKLEFKEACNIVPDPEASHKLVLPVVVRTLPWKFPAAQPGLRADIVAQLNQRNCFPNPAKGALMDDFDGNMQQLMELLAPFAGCHK